MDATVESSDYEHPQLLVQETPFILTNVWSSGITFVQTNGWLIFGIILAGYFIWNKFQSSVKENVEKVLLGKAKKEDGPNSDEKLRLAREKMQQDLERKAELYKEKQKQKAEEERLKKLEAMNEKKNETPDQNDSNNKKAPLFKSEYNPLMGSGPVNNYRPPRRSACSRGGCGR